MVRTAGSSPADISTALTYSRAIHRNHGSLRSALDRHGTLKYNAQQPPALVLLTRSGFANGEAGRSVKEMRMKKRTRIFVLTVLTVLIAGVTLFLPCLCSVPSDATLWSPVFLRVHNTLLAPGMLLFWWLAMVAGPVGMIMVSITSGLVYGAIIVGLVTAFMIVWSKLIGQKST